MGREEEGKGGGRMGDGVVWEGTGGVGDKGEGGERMRDGMRGGWGR